MTAWGFRKGIGMDLKGLPQTVQNFIEETIQNRENGKFPDNETCQKVMEYAADTGSQKLAGLGLYYLAEYYWQNDQYENTLQCLTESIGYLKNEQMYELLARTYNMMGAVSDRKNMMVSVMAKTAMGIMAMVLESSPCTPLPVTHSRTVTAKVT